MMSDWESRYRLLGLCTLVDECSGDCSYKLSVTVLNVVIDRGVIFWSKSVVERL